MTRRSGDPQQANPDAMQAMVDAHHAIPRIGQPSEVGVHKLNITKPACGWQGQWCW